MSAENSIARSGRDVDQPAERSSFEIPPELSNRYLIRVVDGQDGEQRLGLFRAGDRITPAIEITNDRIVARSEDAETVASLIKIAQHNGWDRIDVDGSAEFRQAVWAAARREGLTVSGYKPTFAEQERMEQARREAAVERQVDGAPQASPGTQAVAGEVIISAAAAATARGRADQERSRGGATQDLSDGDRRLLLSLSRHTEDRTALYERLRPDMDGFDREVQYERIDANREALDGALERALESPTLVEAFARSGYAPDALRQAGKGGEWDGEVADAIYLVRSQRHRDMLARDASAVATLVDEIDADRESRSVAESTIASAERPTARERGHNQAHNGAAERRHDGEALAELFLHGGAESVATEPRLVGAVKAQTAMEQHIGEVFAGDVNGKSAAHLESRQLISEVLRRGLDVSVREATPVRQIEPVQAQPNMER